MTTFPIQTEMENKMSKIILGIESSCDETAASISRDGREILSDVVYSQADVNGC